MRVAVVHNQDTSGVINVFGIQNRERYNPKTVERVASALETAGHTVRVIDGNMHVIDQLREFMPRVMAGERPGMVFNMAYGIQGVSRYTHLPAMLEMLGVPYVGSGPQAHGLALDKVIAKMVFDAEGIPTPRFWNFSTPDARFDDLEFPVIVKPKMEAVSYGIRVVHDWDELHTAVAEIMAEFQQHVLVEQFIPGREFAVGLLGNSPPEVLPIVEFDLEGDPNAIQTADNKLSAPKAKICPAPLEEARAEELRALAQRSFGSLGLYDFARIDVRMDAEGRMHVLEINSMASLGTTGSYVHAAKAAGYSYADLVARILDVAAVRYFGTSYLDERQRDTAGRAAPPKLSTQVRSHVRSNQTTCVEVLRRMVDMRSRAADPEQVNAFGDWISGQLRTLGFEREVHAHHETGDSLLFANGDGDAFDVLLFGHLDTAAGSRFRRFAAEGVRIFGSGVAEHKGGLAVMLSALRALRYGRALRRARVGILLIADETLGGARSRSLVETSAARARYVIGLKAGELDGGVVVSRSGRSTYHADLTASERAEASPEEAAEVVRAASRRVDSVLGLMDADAGVRVAITDLRLAGAFSRLPDEAQIAFTLRFNEPQLAAELDERVRRIFKRNRGPARFEVRGGQRRPPRQASEFTLAFADSVASLAGELNLNVPTAHRWHSSSICFVPPDTPTLDGFGPAGTSERTPDEHILRGSLTDRASLLALTIDQCRRTSA